MRFLRLGLRTRIYLGFAMLVTLALGLAGFGMLGLSNVAKFIDAMNAVIGNLVRLQEVAAQLEVIQRAANRYNIDGDAAALDAMKESEARAAAVLVEAANATLSEQRRKDYNGVAEMLRLATS